MSIPTLGPLSLADLRVVFGGGPGSIRLGDYLRGGVWVPVSSATPAVPQSGPISLATYRGARNALDVDYVIIGGGGGGGRGTANRPVAADRCRIDPPFAGSPGGASQISLGAVTLAEAGGGLGGKGQCEAEASQCWAVAREYAGCPGEASPFGPGGAKTPANNHGADASPGSYGAGGAGAGGDNYDTYDEPGYPGTGGQAGTYLTGTLLVDVGQSLRLQSGAPGVGGSGASSAGGRGAGGLVRLSHASRAGPVVHQVVGGLGADLVVTW
jgi:hypothetical protein